MSFLCWNCRGLGNPRTVRALRSLVKRKAPDVLFLQETKLDNMKMDHLRRNLGFQKGFFVSRVGQGGGLALLWHSELEVLIEGSSNSHIDALIKDTLSRSTWRFTGFYGQPVTHRRWESWDLLRDLG